MNVLFKAIASGGHMVVPGKLMICQTQIAAHADIWTLLPDLARYILHIKEDWSRG